MMIDILKSNRQNILDNLDEFRTELDQLREMLLQEEYENLHDRLDLAASHHQGLGENAQLG